MAEESKSLKTWDDVVYDVMPEFERIARQNQLVTWEKESHFAMQAIKKNPSLYECAVDTIQSSIINVAAIGLTLNPADQYAYLVPEYNKATKQKECQLRISFKGLVKVATETGAILWVKADVVKQNDDFEYRGMTEMPIHRMNPFGDRGDTIGVYCVAKTHDVYLVDMISIDELKKIRACAKTDAIWSQWPDEMAKKACIKRASKQWPKTEMSSRLHHAIDVVNQVEGTDFDDFAELEEYASSIKTRIEEDDQLGVGELWVETTDKQKEYLWKAITKGGFFTQAEKTYIRESIIEWHSANTEVIDGEAEEEPAQVEEN